MISYWICCRTTYGREFSKDAELRKLGYITYLPVRKTDIRTKRKCRTETSPLYPPYLFVRVMMGIDGTDIHPIKRVVQIVTMGGEPAIASDGLINLIKSREKEGIHVTKSEYAEGDHVSLKTGILKDYQAEIVKLTRSDKALIREITTGKEFEVKLSDLRPITA